MIEEVFINQGEDIDFELTYEQKNGAPLDMSNLSTKVYLVVHDAYGNIVGKFTNQTPGSGWVAIEPSLLANGTVKCSLLSTITKLLPAAKYYTELKARFASAVHTDDGYFDVEETAYAFTIKKSIVNTISTLP